MLLGLPLVVAVKEGVADVDDDEEGPPAMDVVKSAEPGFFFPFPGEDKVGDVGTEGAGDLTEGGERIKKLAMTARKKQMSPKVRIVHGQLTSWKRFRVA